MASIRRGPDDGRLRDGYHQALILAAIVVLAAAVTAAVLRVGFIRRTLTVRPPAPVDDVPDLPHRRP
ncbi:hypothetical protein Sme01_04330 [Sphaerisporangium melleum]|uniref:Uncharacterized protein n=1 Tax=Sphaerisporangium melleum TaxID=321316 RepID=A0A917QPS3_9ACTN|nr:hypothetical protein [Sphaerisporangium melleum]GGK62345.1 hypothetical protein GCM10007964_01880 [Sphaerisporangium melleum]GII67957.1 hypothetical protein Sme01_04330 [Sphaerisporangium melleum]